MDTPSNYIPIDVRHAIVNDQERPERLYGAALFADISGFTPLTEALARELGPRRGAEELAVHLNRVYDALVAELHRFGGSVISFSGDAITCWLNEDDGRRAIATALAMQRAMDAFANVRTASGSVVTLALKVAAVTGSVRRFTVGDGAYCRIDTMAGTLMETLAAAESHAERGDVVIDASTAARFDEHLAVAEWRSDAAEAERFAVVTHFSLEVEAQPWPELADDALSEDAKSAWLLPPVYERLRFGLGEFLAELRPAYALFVRFTGIDYENDPEAASKLDRFIWEVQHILTRLDGSLLQLTIGDKGSYFYIAYGAPIAHEDDAVRIANTAIEIQDLAASLPYLDPLQIGITTGRMRAGAYGSVVRRTYGVIGDAVNLSARLMTAARPGQILVSDEAKDGMGDRFLWEALPSIRVKGKSEPVTLARLVGVKREYTIGLLEPAYQLPMVGRTAELSLIREKLEQLSAGAGHIVGITGEAGMGKSRLTAEVVQLARAADIGVLGGECESYGMTTSYLVWRGIWRGFFDLDASLSADAQVSLLETRLAELDSDLLPRLPLLGAILNLTIPENELTSSLDPKVRKSSLEDLLVRCLEAYGRSRPLVIILEDCQWLDDLSRDLIGVIGTALSTLPILLVLVYRPLDSLQERSLPVVSLANFTEVSLGNFTAAETRQLIELKLAQVFGEEIVIPEPVLNRVITQAGGNPFYIEELLNYLHDIGVDFSDVQALESVDLPDSIYSLVLSRIDKLAEDQQLTIKVASVIGRLFRAGMLWGIYPELSYDQLQQNLDVLSDLELTPLETPEPELVYLFKHIITQQVAYGSMLYRTRAILHEQIGSYIERNYADAIEQYINILAFHYENSENQEKKRTYLLGAGEMAQRNYANSAAISYYEKTVPLLDGRALGDVRLKLGQALELTGEWGAASDQYEAALAWAQENDDQELAGWSQTALGEVARKRNEYDNATRWFEQARATFEALGLQDGIRQVLHYAGTLAANRGDYSLASQQFTASLELSRQLSDRKNEASMLNNLGIVARYLGDRSLERQYYEASLQISEEIGNRWLMALLRNNLGNMAIDTGDTVYARQQLDQALVIWREIGERWAENNTIHNLANVARDEGASDEALRLYGESVSGWRRLDDNWGLAYWLEDAGLYYVKQNLPERAIQLISVAAVLRNDIGAARPPSYQAKLDAAIGDVTSEWSAEQIESAHSDGAALSIDAAVNLALTGD